MLERKTILATKNTPEIVLDPSGKIHIKGRSISGEVKALPEEVEIWLDSYLLDPSDITLIEIYLDYIGGFSSGYYLEIVKKIKDALSQNKKLVVNWYYEEGDEDILEKGECFSIYLGLPFNFILLKDPSVNNFDINNL